MTLTYIKTSNWKWWGVGFLCVLALGLGIWWQWRAYHPNQPVPAQQQAQEAVNVATQALAEANDNIKKGKALIRKLPGEVRQIEEAAVHASRNSDLNELAVRANQRIRNWVTTHSTSNSVQPSDTGTGTVLPGGSRKTQ